MYTVLAHGVAAVHSIFLMQEPSCPFYHTWCWMLRADVHRIKLHLKNIYSIPCIEIYTITRYIKLSNCVQWQIPCQHSHSCHSFVAHTFYKRIRYITHHQCIINDYWLTFSSQLHAVLMARFCIGHQVPGAIDHVVAGEIDVVHDVHLGDGQARPNGLPRNFREREAWLALHLGSHPACMRLGIEHPMDAFYRHQQPHAMKIPRIYL